MPLQKYKQPSFTTQSGVLTKNLELSYQIFGQPLGQSPIVLVHHALTGNSDVASDEFGWWKTLIGHGKTINLDTYTVLAIDVLGNGYESEYPSHLNQKDFSIYDIAQLFYKMIDHLGITQLFACIGGSVGGGIAWEMAVQRPFFIQKLVPIASDWKASDWIIGHNHIQEQILNKSPQGLETARMMAMLFYRTPESFVKKFNREQTDKTKEYKVNSWLDFHGNRLQERYSIESYKMMNHLLATLDITKYRTSFSETVKPITSEVIQVGINSDLYFSASENKKTKLELDALGIKNSYYEIDSIHGHDAFLIEYDQLSQILHPVFNTSS